MAVASSQGLHVAETGDFPHSLPLLYSKNKYSPNHIAEFKTEDSPVQHLSVPGKCLTDQLWMIHFHPHLNNSTDCIQIHLQLSSQDINRSLTGSYNYIYYIMIYNYHYSYNYDDHALAHFGHTNLNAMVKVKLSTPLKQRPENI